MASPFIYPFGCPFEDDALDFVGSFITKLPPMMASKSSGVGFSLERHMSAIDSKFLMSALNTLPTSHAQCHNQLPRTKTNLLEDSLGGIVGRFRRTQCSANCSVCQRFLSQCSNFLSFYDVSQQHG